MKDKVLRLPSRAPPLGSRFDKKRSGWFGSRLSSPMSAGTCMYIAASGWLMTSLDADPLTVSLVQVASSLPMFLFALPAGALADIVDKRRYLHQFLPILAHIIPPHLLDAGRLESLPRN